MFPTLQFSLTGLDANKYYNVFVEIVLADPQHWKFQSGEWKPTGHADPLPKGLYKIIIDRSILSP